MDELKHHNVLATAAYLDAVKYQPSPRRTQIETSRVERNFYRQIFSVYRNPIEQTAAMAPFLQIGRIDVSAAIEAEFQRLGQYGLYHVILRCTDVSALADSSLLRASLNTLPCTTSSASGSRRAMRGPEPAPATPGREGCSRIAA